MDNVIVKFKESKFVNIRVPEKDIFFDWLEDNKPKDISPSIREMKTELIWVLEDGLLCPLGTYYAYISYAILSLTPDGIEPYTVKLSESMCDLLCLPYGTQDPEEHEKG